MSFCRFILGTKEIKLSVWHWLKIFTFIQKHVGTNGLKIWDDSQEYWGMGAGPPFRDGTQ